MARTRHDVGRGAVAPGTPRTAPYQEYREYDMVGRAVGPARGPSWATGVNLLLGAWLIIAPWVLGYPNQNNAVWNEVLVGAAIVVFTVIRMGAPERTQGLSWLNAGLGIWLIVAPWVLSYSQVNGGNANAIYWNDVLVGIAVAILGWISASAGHGRGVARV